MAWGNNRDGWHSSGDGWHALAGLVTPVVKAGMRARDAYNRGYDWDAYYAREKARRKAPWTSTVAQQSTQPGYYRRAITGQQTEMPDYAQNYTPMVPNLSATVPLPDTNLPGPPEPNLAPEEPAVVPALENPVVPPPAAPRYQSLGMDSALANYSGLPVKPRRGSIYTLVLGAR